MKRSTNDDIVCIIFDRMLFLFFLFTRLLAVRAKTFLISFRVRKMVGVPHFSDSTQQPIRKIGLRKEPWVYTMSFKLAHENRLFALNSFSLSPLFRYGMWWYRCCCYAVVGFFSFVVCVFCVCIFLKIQHFSVFPSLTIDRESLLKGATFLLFAINLNLLRFGECWPRH